MERSKFADADFLETNPVGRVGNWQETYTGKIFWPLDPREDEIDIVDIARALSHQCRFGGHLDTFFSVAQHSVIVSDFLPAGMKLQGLLHDASEGYIVDIPRPIKPFLGGYKEIEDKIMRVIASKYGFEYPMNDMVKIADNTSLAIEKRCFKKQSTQTWDCQSLDDGTINIVPLSPDDAMKLFLEKFEELRGK